MIALVAPDTKTGSGVELFSYTVPLDLASKIIIGSVVKIPFGKRKIRGVVFELMEEVKKEKYSLKPIAGLEETFLPKSFLKVARWMREYYLCSLGEAISLFLPPEMKRPRKECIRKQFPPAVSIKLSPSQNEIFLKLKALLDRRESSTSLILGVTGSGKTEIYLKLVAETLKKGKQVIALVPEIVLTPQTIARFEAAFPRETAIMHSGLSASEKYRCWHDYFSGNKKIIIGPRSALLIPTEKTGLIIVDEEQEDAYKQESTPRYHAVRLAQEIVSRLNIPLVLGTATPRVETFFRSQNGDINYFELKKRFGAESLPLAKIVDLKDEIKAGNNSVISRELQEKLSFVLGNNKQALLFLNRRGSSTFVSCRDCGYVVECANCSLPMVYHLNFKTGFLSCHHCESKSQVPEICPQCGSSKIKFFGAGIEKLFAEAKSLFPNAKIEKLEADGGSKNKYEEVYEKVLRKEIDFLIGTQLIAKGLDLPDVDLVGIVSADTGLHMPSYRANEKLFQLLTQVSGRSGRRENQGETIIQTYWPESFTVLTASKHDFSAFYSTEIENRKLFNYPPFCHLVRIVTEQPSNSKAVEMINNIAADLKRLGKNFIGPGCCFYSRLRGKYRHHLILKLDKLPDNDVLKLSESYPQVIFDVDPTNLL